VKAKTQNRKEFVMSDILHFETGWKRRIEKEAAVIEAACEGENATNLMANIAKMEKEVATSCKYYCEMLDSQVKNSLESEKNHIELERNESNAKLEAEHNEIEAKKVVAMETQTAVQAKSDKWKIILGFVGAMAAPIMSILFDHWKEKKRHERFMLSADAENNHGHAYLSKTDRAMVDEGLKDTTGQQKSGFRFPFFK
jgi:hypothetical protein